MNHLVKSSHCIQQERPEFPGSDAWIFFGLRSASLDRLTWIFMFSVIFCFLLVFFWKFFRWDFCSGISNAATVMYRRLVLNGETLNVRLILHVFFFLQRSYFREIERFVCELYGDTSSEQRKPVHVQFSFLLCFSQIFLRYILVRETASFTHS